jgi:glutamate-ammonia-ligase adenylyltransferase
MLESLARFTMTQSQIDPQVVFARFRRRELLRIYLRDIRRLATIAEITEEISNLADAILVTALKLSLREMNNRFGSPQETDEKGRIRPARFCIVALGKLGSRELNYASDIDLQFLYSNEGTTSGIGSRGSVTNREYFIKIAEFVVKLIGQQTGEGAAYRVDLRLRPHGSLGALAMSVDDTVRYHKTEARPWERQVLIRSRGCAGDIELFHEFFVVVEPLVFESDVSVEDALRNVRLSKDQIDRENVGDRGFNVKLGRGGIREIEFLAQALQLAFGGKDRWLRTPHTLISLSRLADRGYLSGTDLTELSTAYSFLRRTEHVLQMENGIQTHTVPEETDKRSLVGRRMTFAAGGDFEADLKLNAENVARIFTRIFGDESFAATNGSQSAIRTAPHERVRSSVLASIEKSSFTYAPTGTGSSVLDRLAEVSPHFSSLLASNPHIAAELPDPNSIGLQIDYEDILMTAARSSQGFGQRLSAIRRAWSKCLFAIVVADVFETLTIRETRVLQTRLAEASISSALWIVNEEMHRKFGVSVESSDLAVLALGKLGGGGLDYDSDLDLVLVYDESKPAPDGVTNAEFYGWAVETFVTTLSSMTRDGSLYRVDLRLRPYGKNGLIVLPGDGFLSYFRETAEVWEMLAFVKLRAVGGDIELGEGVEFETRHVIHERAMSIDPEILRDETRRVRHALEKQRARSRRGSDVDIKYGSGGMLDIYFAMRFLQLRDNIPDDANDRSTKYVLELLRESVSLSSDDHRMLAEGYAFLSELDHNLRLTVGRTTRIPFANQSVMSTIAGRMRISSVSELNERLTLHRLEIRSAFESIVIS